MGERRSPHARPLPVADIRTVGEVITLANGRRLGFAQYGDPAGKALLFFHGTRGSRLLGRGLDAAARRHGIRLIAPEHPGYGKWPSMRAKEDRKARPSLLRG
jgi:hypothetical protein